MIFPLGPYHPALIEPLSLQLATRGERVTGVDFQTGYLHRGTSALAQQRDLPGVLDLVERICGTCGQSHRLAVCLALETVAQIVPSARATALRMVFAEIERLQSALWLLVQCARVTHNGELLAAALEAREMLAEACTEATGQRLFWGVAVPGGVSIPGDIGALDEALEAAQARMIPVISRNGRSSRYWRRYTDQAVISEDAVTNLHLSGPMQRASGFNEDQRVISPYAEYQQFAETLAESETIAALPQPDKPVQGDIWSRVGQAFLDIEHSLLITTALLQDLPNGQDQIAFPDRLTADFTTATIEGPHGTETVNLNFAANAQGGRGCDLTRPGWLAALQVQTPSAVNAGIVPIVLNGIDLEDVPVTLASLNLCIACIDQ